LSLLDEPTVQDGGETLKSVHLDQMSCIPDELQARPGYRLGQGVSPVDRRVQASSTPPATSTGSASEPYSGCTSSLWVWSA
jgi:hypothetical protein